LREGKDFFTEYINTTTLGGEKIYVRLKEREKREKGGEKYHSSKHFIGDRKEGTIRGRGTREIKGRYGLNNVGGGGPQAEA